uniref:ATP synthase-coupling factor 6, mitochondrial n=1 Tax=Romanomermis culicivorax TaxID=13658 RepID=A0A915K9T9_ROMCU
MSLYKAGLFQSRIVCSAVKRCLNLSPALAQQMKVKDPIQQLFLDKIREYDSKLKSKTDKDSLVDASVEQEKAYKEELDRISKEFLFSLWAP